MEEEKNLRQLILETAKERHLDESIVNGILRLAEGENQKLADLLKIYDLIQELEAKDAAVNTLPENLDTEDMSQYSENELRTMQARLEEYLRGCADGECPEDPPPDRRSPSDRQPPKSVPAPGDSRGENAKRNPPSGINLKLGDFLHG